MIVKKFILKARARLHHIYNSQEIINSERLQAVLAEFPDSGQVRSLLLHLEKATSDGQFTHVYLHNDKKRLPEIEFSIDRRSSKYPPEK